ncbi:autotransporter outer membrane beta-barrel domain-containing protein [Bartonella melophagi]|uniref:Outer membrane autotransporter barrel domain-containing protein n=1 Tax=Bartonella melophagi K-2C TaxID=1094557 RepID=J0QY03_9HYPH|nr:autotransporter outer membrane beta-barrel domain-containing protein [Bartonella melophagi]EJF88074.1 outer membrane autotransporter barrel domain-containing protein [Bartonella melophagi K-2C]
MMITVLKDRRCLCVFTVSVLCFFQNIDVNATQSMRVRALLQQRQSLQERKIDAGSETVIITNVDSENPYHVISKIIEQAMVGTRQQPMSIIQNTQVKNSLEQLKVDNGGMIAISDGVVHTSSREIMNVAVISANTGSSISLVRTDINVLGNPQFNDRNSGLFTSSAATSTMNGGSIDFINGTGVRSFLGGTTDLDGVKISGHGNNTDSMKNNMAFHTSLGGWINFRNGSVDVIRAHGFLIDNAPFDLSARGGIGVSPIKPRISKVNVENSTIIVKGEASYGVFFHRKQTQERRQTADFLSGLVSFKKTTLLVPDNTAIYSYGTEGHIALLNSKISGDLLLEAKNGSSVTVMADASLLSGGARVFDENTGELYLTNGSRWIITRSKTQDPQWSSVAYVMIKDSAIVFERPTSDDYQTLHIGKGSGEVYNAKGGGAQIYLNVSLEGGSQSSDQKSDRVLIYGDVSGTTTVHVLGMSGHLREKVNTGKNDSGISIIQVSGKAKQNSFVLDSDYVVLPNFPYQYHLIAYGSGSEFGKADPRQRLVEGKGDFWDFRLENKYIKFGVKAVVSQVPTYLLLPNALFYAGLMDINNQTELLGTMVTLFDPFFNGKPAFFIRGYGGSHNYTSDLSTLEYGYGGKFGYHAIEAATLLNRLESEQSSTFIGVIGTYGELSLQPQDVEKSKKSNFDHWSVTAYASLQHNTGFYVNGLLSYGLSRGDVETLARGKTAKITGKPLRAALTGGKAFLTGYEGLVFEPQMQLIYQYLMFNSARDIGGFDIKMGSPSQLTTRLGGRLTKELTGIEEESSVSFYGKLHLMGSFGGKQFVQFKDTFQLGAFGSSMEAGVGVQAQLSSQIALHGDVVYQQKLTKAGFSGSTFSGGLRYRF